MKNLLDPEVLSWRLNAQFDSRIIEDLYEMRQCFEPRACFLAAREGTVSDLQRIQRSLADLISTIHTPTLAASAETEFHLAIIAATHNGLFATIGGAVKTALRVSFALTQKALGQPGIDLYPYRSVVNAIVERRGDEASEAMRGLLELSRLRVLGALESAASSA